MEVHDAGVRPHNTRRRHQAALQRQHRRRRQRRQARVRRIHLLRAFISVRFWTRSAIVFGALLAFAFWAKFALVFDIPDYARHGVLSNVNAYVTVKPWWFGPPAFDLGDYGQGILIGGANRYALFIQDLGKYDGIVLHPQFIWVSR